MSILTNGSRLTPNGAPTKSCPKCENIVHAARRGCECGYTFQSKAVEESDKPAPPTENSIVAACLPEGFGYAGKLNIAGHPLYVAYKQDDSIRLKANQLKKLVEVCWRHHLNRIPKSELNKFIL